MENSQITTELCVDLYKTYMNEYLTLAVFSEHMNYKYNIEKPVSFWESIVNRGRIALNGARYFYFTGRFTTNRFNNKRRIDRLLLEHSA